MNMMRKYILGLVKTMDAAKELLAEPTKSVSNVPYALRYQSSTSARLSSVSRDVLRMNTEYLIRILFDF